MRIKIVIHKPGLEARRLFFKRNYWLILKLLKQVQGSAAAPQRVHLVLEDLPTEEDQASHILLQEEDNLSQKEVHFTLEPLEQAEEAQTDEFQDEEEFILSDAVEETTHAEPELALEESSNLDLDLDTDEGLGDFNFDEIQ